ncbi:MAG: protein kinase [Planctomycetota bacterium]
MDPDLRLGHIAVRMGAIRPQDLPQLMREARIGVPDERGKPVRGLGQILLKRGLISIDDYLYMARQVSEEQEANQARQALEQVTTAWTAYESGELDRAEFEEILGRSGEPILRPTEPVRTFGPYTLEGEVARGGMGIVYRAHDPSGRIVALKVMINADDDEVRLRRFEREAELAAALEHPNVVSIHDAGRIDGIPYFTMDLIDGESLEDLMERGLEFDELIKVLIQVSRGLSHAHERGVVHRDLKPGNILVDARGDAHITDFGLARDLARLTRLTAVGQAVGTPYYMAPEQVRGERDVDGRADVYAAGVILYEGLTGDVPFDAETPLTLFRKIDSEPVLLELDEELGIDEHIRTIALRALAKEREDRYADAALLAEDLERYQQGLPPRAAGPKLATRLFGHRLFVPAATLALLALISAGFAGTLLYRRHRERAAFDGGVAAAEAALDSMETALEQAGAALTTKQPEAACTLAAEGLALTPQGDDATPRGRGVAQGFREGGGPALLERLHRVHLEAWVARSAQDVESFPRALEALSAATAPEVQASPELALAAGILLTRAGRPVEALPHLDRAVVALEERPDALLARARARVDLDQHLGAAADLSTALSADAPSGEALLLRARAYLAQRRLAAALTDAQRAHDLDLRDPAPLLVLGDVAREQGELDAARAHYLAAAGQDPQDTRVELRLAELALRTGEPARALVHLDEAVRRGGPQDTALRVRAHLARFDLAAAREVAGTPPRLRGLPRDQRQALAAWHTARAELLLCSGDVAGAWGALEDALREDPRHDVAALWAADLALRPDGPGATALRRVVEAAGTPPPGSARWLLARARLALAEDDLAEARELAEHAEKFADELLRPQVVELLGDLEPERTPSSEAWEAGLAGPELCATLTRAGRERVALGEPQPGSALAQSGVARLRAALTLDPERLAARVALAAALGAQGQTAEARAALEPARALALGQPELARTDAALALRAQDAHALTQAAVSLEAVADPSPELVRLAARVALARERTDEALALVEALGERGHALRAEVLAQLGREDDAAAAAAAWDAALAERETLAELATRTREAGEAIDRVIEVLERAVRLGPRFDTTGLQLRLRLASSYRDPRARLEALEELVRLPDPGLLDAADAALRPVWTPLTGEAQQSLLRRARDGAPGPRAAVVLAAAEDALAGGQDAPRLRLGQRHAAEALEAAPGSFGLHVLAALLDVRLGFPYRARARLEVLNQVDASSNLLRYALAEAAAGCGDGATADALLLRLREEDPSGPWSERSDRSPLLRDR